MSEKVDIEDWESEGRENERERGERENENEREVEYAYDEAVVKRYLELYSRKLDLASQTKEKEKEKDKDVSTTNPFISFFIFLSLYVFNIST